MTSFVDTITKKSKRECDLAWNEFFCENAIAPFVSSSESFKRLNRMLRPAYLLAGPAGPKSHLGELLTHTAKDGTWGSKKTDRLYATLPGRKCLGLDGLTDNFSDPMVNFVEIKAGYPRFLKSEFIAESSTFTTCFDSKRAEYIVALTQFRLCLPLD